MLKKKTVLKAEYNDQLEKGLVLPVMEEFYSIQGEGFHTGKAAYFIRIGGCDVGCSWCDVKESWNAEAFPPSDVHKLLLGAIRSKARSVVVTGGEPWGLVRSDSARQVMNLALEPLFLCCRMKSTTSRTPEVNLWNFFVQSRNRI